MHNKQGNVFLIIKDASDGVVAQLKRQSISCITKRGVTDLLDKLNYEEKHEVLSSIAREFNRELLSDVCRTCRRVEKTKCPYAVGAIEFEQSKDRSSLSNLNKFLDR